MLINATKLHNELVAAGIPIEGVAATEPPRIDFRPEATPAQQRQAQEILAAHVPEDHRDKREQAYRESGVTVEAMIVALWERVVEGRVEMTEELQQVREDVKRRFPKSTS